MSTVEGFRLARRRFTISPAFEKKFAGMPRYLSASTANITPFAHTDKAQLTSDYE